MSSDSKSQRAWLDARDAVLEAEQRLRDGQGTAEDLDAAKAHLQATDEDLI